MHELRRILGILLVVSFPPAVIYWLVIHPLVGWWRRRGAVFSFVAVTTLMAALAAALFLARDALLGADLGRQPVLLVLGGALYALAIWIEVQCRRQLSLRTFVGVPELSSRAPGAVLRDGIYGVVRHPRYLAVTTGTLGVALAANYLGVYLVLATCDALLYLVILLEERELIGRFGVDYLDYVRRVPRLFPRRASNSSAPRDDHP